MLIRFIAKNTFSIGDDFEFNAIPNNKIQNKKKEHRQRIADDFNVLKMSAFYGANAAGKSNILKALEELKDFIILGEKTNSKNKLTDEDVESFLVEYAVEGTAFIYEISIENKRVLSEELHISGLGNKGDRLLFRREKGDVETSDQLKFSDANLLKVIKEEFLEDNKTLFSILANRKTRDFDEIKLAYKWFSQHLHIVSKSSKPRNLVGGLWNDNKFRKFTEEMITNFYQGLNSLEFEETSVDEYFYESKMLIDKIKEKFVDENLENLPINHNGQDVVILREEDQLNVLELKINHSSRHNQFVKFGLDDESDGTLRFIDLIPIFYSILEVKHNNVYFVDEIESSLHPIIIRKLLTILSHSKESGGQLFFTTHESTLLDLSILRQDEIWFVEKNSFGFTQLYSLNEFKEHNTLDIRKGYLSGKYGAIPFLGNIENINSLGSDA